MVFSRSKLLHPIVFPSPANSSQFSHQPLRWVHATPTCFSIVYMKPFNRATKSSMNPTISSSLVAGPSRLAPDPVVHQPRPNTRDVNYNPFQMRDAGRGRGGNLAVEQMLLGPRPSRLTTTTMMMERIDSGNVRLVVLLPPNQCPHAVRLVYRLTKTGSYEWVVTPLGSHQPLSTQVRCMSRTLVCRMGVLWSKHHPRAIPKTDGHSCSPVVRMHGQVGVRRDIRCARAEIGQALVTEAKKLLLKVRVSSS